MKKIWLVFLSRFWEKRSKQEKRGLLVSATALLPLVFYAMLWHPAHSNVEKLRTTLPAMRAQAVRLQEQGNEAIALRHLPLPARLDANNLKSAIEASAKQHLLRDSISNLNLVDGNNVRITLDSVSFAQLLQWLHVLQLEQHISAQYISVAALPQPGFVSATATLSNGSTP